MQRRHRKTKRQVRLSRELKRKGRPNQGHGWAAKQAARRKHHRTKHESHTK